MPRCPQCGFDVSAAVGVCGVCQTRLDGSPASTPGAASGASPESLAVATGAPARVVTAAFVLFTVAWLVLAVWFGLPRWAFPLGAFAGVVAWALTTNAGGLVDSLREQTRTVEDPVFGRLTAKIRPNREWHVWNGEVAHPGTGNKAWVAVFGGPDGPSDLQRKFFRELVGDLERHEAAGATAVADLDRSQWPEALRSGPPVLILSGIDLEDDEDTRSGVFSLQFTSPADTEGTYYVDFEGGKVCEASRG